MNDLIKDLLKQSTYDCMGVPQVDQKKFADLIIRECAAVCMKEIDTGWVMAPKSPWMAKQILEHFGVEE